MQHAALTASPYMFGSSLLVLLQGSWSLFLLHSLTHRRSCKVGAAYLTFCSARYRSNSVSEQDPATLLAMLAAVAEQRSMCSSGGDVW